MKRLILLAMISMLAWGCQSVPHQHTPQHAPQHEREQENDSGEIWG